MIDALQLRGELDMNLEALAAAWAPRLLSVMRIMTGLLLLEHGTGKIFKFPVVPAFAKVDLGSMFGISGLFELIGGALLVVGLFTRPVAFILSGMCAVGYFLVHAARGGVYPILNGGDGIILFCFILLYIAAAGPGPWSIDAARKK
jgi:putative oxidoreductase